MKKLIFFLLVILITITSFAQDGKSLIKDGWVTFIASPIDSVNYKLEVYVNGKVWFLFYEDTLHKEPTFGDLIGDSITLKRWNNTYSYETLTKKGKTISEVLKAVDSCDNSINYIKNSAVRHQTWRNTNDTARKYIGYSNKEYLKFERKHSVYEPASICSYTYKILVNKFKQDSYTEIARIYGEKVKRYEWFTENTHKVDTLIILNFIDSFDACKTDIKTLEFIMSNKPDLFLQSCDKLDDDDFFSFGLAIDFLPATPEKTNAISQLEKSEIKSRRKNKILRALKRT